MSIIKFPRWATVSIVILVILLTINTITSLVILYVLSEAVVMDMPESQPSKFQDPKHKLKEYHTKVVLKRFKVKEELAQQVVAYAHEYERDVFPKAVDILAIISIESSFNPNAKSSLKYDPAIGLTQIRPGIWNIKKDELKSIENQVKFGVNILSQYYEKLHKKDAAIMAYNVGITAYRNGETNQRYLWKYKQALKDYNTGTI